MLQARGSGSSPTARLALAELCESYWLPLYAFVRRHTRDIHEAQDLTQAFFAQLLSKKYLNDVQPDRGLFRSFLLAAIKHFLSNQRDREKALKRGGGVIIQSLDWQRGEERVSGQLCHDITAERLFEREWALALLDRVLERLKAEQSSPRKQAAFEVLSGCLAIDRAQIDYSAAAETLQQSEEAVRVAAHRLRKRYRHLLRDEIAHTTATPDDVEAELRSLFEALR